MKYFILILVIFFGVSCQRNIEKSKEFAKEEALVMLNELIEAKKRTEDEYEKRLKEFGSAEIKLSQGEIKQTIVQQEELLAVLQKLKDTRVTEGDKQQMAESIEGAKARIKELKKQIE